MESCFVDSQTYAGCQPKPRSTWARPRHVAVTIGIDATDGYTIVATSKSNNVFTS